MGLVGLGGEYRGDAFEITKSHINLRFKLIEQLKILKKKLRIWCFYMREFNCPGGTTLLRY
jgi:hypothetical protein